ncbi:ABC transporter substrate-binding protein [Amycolatopsis mediterranei S699]|uniref:ABC transport system substrate-binding protein n=3 Tax=Amycolatopsis mediterranei TaxID=33910 RepID=A0A0H3CWK0_AMYMU|nr:MCE family protein [Amycolatopsis mediterranei]AAS07744.1 putative lipoprotein [Amycolatopsis mediterranei S699]ADJ42425.1 ABC transport system substrate-binding protein [Amycolatopsis mediterranei U32]AEK39111.1 ABC transporter substrate-binding protein [Amycolatopsis mediterranei S699]AFO74139.1 ABC transporter substrate-binding protein [Amycolatopsis mediterranei S699]AGT81268.1 ABC transporter substrate-binding protein [Amycolatopsis mediterranei RB]
MRGLLAPLIKLGIFVVVTVLFTTILGISIANINTTSTNAYNARFTDATLLLPNDDVRIAGVRVGQVKDVHIVDKRQAEVEFEVDAGRTLPAGVTAQIKFRNLVGQRYVSLGEGDDSAGKTLPPGGTIPLERTTPALDLTELFNGFKPLFTALNPEDVNKLSYEVIQVLQGEGGTVESLLSHTASLATTIADKDQVIGEVIDNLNSVLDTVNAHTPQLNDLIVKLQQLVSGLAADRKPIGDAIESLGNLAQTTSGLLGEVREPLKNDIDALGNLTSALNKNEPELEHFIQFLPTKVSTLTRTADYGSWFNFYACEFSGSVSLPPLINDVALPLIPANRARCQG